MRASLSTSVTESYGFVVFRSQARDETTMNYVTFAGELISTFSTPLTRYKFNYMTSMTCR